MGTNTSGTSGTVPAGRGLQRPGYGTPSPALLARAGRGLARFLATGADSPDARPSGRDAVR